MGFVLIPKYDDIPPGNDEDGGMMDVGTKKGRCRSFGFKEPVLLEGDGGTDRFPGSTDCSKKGIDLGAFVFSSERKSEKVPEPVDSFR